MQSPAKSARRDEVGKWYTCLRRQARTHMYFVYILKSEDKEWFYIGLSSNPLKRLSEHNQGKTKSTRFKRPFEIVFKKSFDSRILARDYEKFLKIRSNKEKLLKSLGLI